MLLGCLLFPWHNINPIKLSGLSCSLSLHLIKYEWSLLCNHCSFQRREIHSLIAWMSKRLLDLIKLELFLVANAFLNFLWINLEGRKYTLLAFAFLRKQKCVEVFLVLMHTQGNKVIFLDAPYPESWNINTHTVINHINEGSPEVHMLTLFHMCTHGLTHYSSSIWKGTTIRSVIYITQWSKLLLWPCFCWTCLMSDSLSTCRRRRCLKESKYVLIGSFEKGMKLKRRGGAI